jgi:pimeloyl-ACP methyl ester carboxylesterase
MMRRMVREHRVDLSGRTTRYLESGAGWPLVLLHAFPLSAEMWRPQLERAPRGWRLIAPDIRGFGASPFDTASVPTMDEYAADVVALLDHLELERAVIGGLSMGGYITFALLRRGLRSIRPRRGRAGGRCPSWFAPRALRPSPIR